MNKIYICKENGYEVLARDFKTLNCFDKKYVENEQIKIIKNSIWEITRVSKDRIYLHWNKGGYENLDKKMNFNIDISIFDFEKYFDEEKQ